MTFLPKVDYKMKNRQFITLLFLLAILFSFSSCSKENQFNLSKEEKIWMDEFFRGIMVQQEAIYTLWGTKPMTLFEIDYYTDEEIAALYAQLSEEQKRTGFSREDCDIACNWEKWEQVRDRFPLHNFLLFKTNHPDDEKYALIYFVNIKNLALTLLENYELFRRETGMDFDPLEEVFNLEKGSEFWDIVFNDPSVDTAALRGIMYGYGVKNSFCFQWKGWRSEEREKLAMGQQTRFSDCPQCGNATLNTLPLPIFASFFPNDEMIEKYKKEREEIKKIYRSKDFLDLTLKKLTSN